MQKIITSALASIFFCIIFTDALFAQHTVIKLPTADSSGSLTIQNSNSTTMMRLNADGGFFILGSGSGSIPISGASRKIVWHPLKGSFRAGRVIGTQWDDANIGLLSIATGYNSTASGDYSMAMGHTSNANATGAAAIGYQVVASGVGSTALGYSTNAGGYASTATGGSTAADGLYSTAMGHATSAKGDYSMAVGDSCSADGLYSIAMGRGAVVTNSGIGAIAMGDHTTASSPSSVAMGYYTTASGFASVAMGDPTVASGYTAIAIGHEVIADGDFSMALGSYAATNKTKGSFIFGDASTEEIATSNYDNQMTMRFDGGYRLYSVRDTKTGVFLPHGANTWQQESDSTKKERIVSADGEYFLKSLKQMRLGSWNYKGQREKQYRHYGPMAQEIFHFFGKDEFGTIGCDTMLATGDMDGIMMICLQALEKRTTELKIAVSELQKTNEKIAVMERNNSEMQKKIERLEQFITSISSDNQKASTASK